MAHPPQHLLFLNQTLGFGGAETFDTQLLRELQDLGWHVSAHTTHPPFAEHLKKHGIQAAVTPWIVDITGNWKGLLKAVWTAPVAVVHYWQILRSQPKGTVLMMSSFSEKILTSSLARLLEIPIVWIEFGPVSPVFEKFGSLPRVLYNWAALFPAAVIVPSHCTQQNLLAETVLGSDRVQIIPCGVTPPHQRFSKKSSRPSIVCVSRMEAGKGQELLVQALPHVLRKFPKAQLTFIGTGDHQTVVEAEVQRLALESHVSFLGFVSDPAPYIATADVCVFPSMWALEGFGMVQIEALSQGVPVIAFARGPATEIITSGRTGLLAKPGDIADLAHCIIKILSSEKLRLELSKAGKKHFTQNYTIATVAKQYDAVLRELRSRPDQSNAK